MLHPWKITSWDRSRGMEQTQKNHLLESQPTYHQLIWKLYCPLAWASQHWRRNVPNIDWKSQKCLWDLEDLPRLDGKSRRTYKKIKLHTRENLIWRAVSQKNSGRRKHHLDQHQKSTKWCHHFAKDELDLQISHQEQVICKVVPQQGLRAYYACDQDKLRDFRKLCAEVQDQHGSRSWRIRFVLFLTCWSLSSTLEASQIYQRYRV